MAGNIHEKASPYNLCFRCKLDEKIKPQAENGPRLYFTQKYFAARCYFNNTSFLV
jgi:hypothetical protein